MSKLRIKEIIVVEGKYDAIKLANIVDTLIVQTSGFSIFTSEETKQLILKMGKQSGIIVLTDSDAAGFKIRNYIDKFASGLNVKHAYIPAQKGKEQRKQKSSKEGLLGVEGINDEVILNVLKSVCTQKGAKTGEKQINYTLLYELGLSGTNESMAKRHEFLKHINLPPRLSKKALCSVLNSIYTYEEFLQIYETYLSL